MRVLILLILNLSLISLLRSQPVRMESIRINGEIPVSCNRDLLESRFRIDSVLTRDIYDNISLSDSIIYIGESLFEYYAPGNIYHKGKSDCVLSTIVFDDQITSVSLGTFGISTNTTVADIQKLFPDFCSEPDDITVYGDPARYTYCSLPTDVEDQEFLLFFREDRVSMVHIWVRS